MPHDARSALFASRTGVAISLSSLEKVFVRLRQHAGLQSPPGARWQPRIHDLRHSFTVNRLIAWYREGADVQAYLPLLSIYLGHVNLSGTQSLMATQNPPPVATSKSPTQPD
jgi:integrase